METKTKVIIGFSALAVVVVVALVTKKYWMPSTTTTTFVNTTKAIAMAPDKNSLSVMSYAQYVADANAKKIKPMSEAQFTSVMTA